MASNPTSEKAGLDALRSLIFSVETNRFHQQVNYLRAVADRPDLKNDSIARMVEQLNEQVKEAKDAEREIPALVAMVRDARKAAEDALRYVEDKWAPGKEAGDRVPKYGGYIEMRPSDAFEPPAKWDEKYRRALNSLRESGKINMFGASPVLQQMFPALSAKEARGIVSYWMKTFKEADEKSAGPAPAPALLASLFSAAVGGSAKKEAPEAEAEKGNQLQVLIPGIRPYFENAGLINRAVDTISRSISDVMKGSGGAERAGIAIKLLETAAGQAQIIKEFCVGWAMAMAHPPEAKEAGEKAGDVGWARQLANALDHEKNAVEDAAMEVSNLLRSVRGLPGFSMPPGGSTNIVPQLSNAAGQINDVINKLEVYGGFKEAPEAEKAHPTTVTIGFDPLKGIKK